MRPSADARRDRATSSRSPVPAPTWWRRPGLDVVDGRLARQRRRPRGARSASTGRPLFVYDLARPRRERPRAPGRARRGRRPVPGAVRAQGVARPADPARCCAGSARRARPRASGIDACSPGRGAPRARQRLAARRDQPHRHQRLRARPRRAARPPDPAQPRRGEPARAGRAAGARPHGRASASTPAPAPATPSTSPTPASGPTKFGVTEDRLDDAIDAARRHGLVVDTLHFHAGSGWLGDQLDGFEAALVAATRFLDRLARRRASRSARSTSAAASAAPARDGRAAGGPRRVRGGRRAGTSTRTASTVGVRARRLRDEGRGRAARRGRDGRAARAT